MKPGRNYRIRKLYVRLNPFLSVHDHAQCVQWIMRDDPLFQRGTPFFFEPWTSPDDFYTRDGEPYRPTPWQVLRRFLREFWRWAKRRATGRFVTQNGTVWKWNRKTRVFKRTEEARNEE